jgi:hypothetical protein
MEQVYFFRTIFEQSFGYFWLNGCDPDPARNLSAEVERGSTVYETLYHSLVRLADKPLSYDNTRDNCK